MVRKMTLTVKRIIVAIIAFLSGRFLFIIWHVNYARGVGGPRLEREWQIPTPALLRFNGVKARSYF
jgi:hypothetical protein